MFTFEWDEAKAAGSLRKHGVSFDEAVTVFGDANALTFADTEHADDEDRSRTYASSSRGCSSWFTRSGATTCASSVRER